MKTSIGAACIAAILVITLIACGLFGSKPKEAAFNIEGEWIIDSIENRTTDSSNNMGIFLLALAQKDSLPLGLRFNNDSSFQFTNVNDSITGSYYLSEDRNSLFVKEDSVFHQLNFITKSDSSFSAITTDSLVYHLKKK